VIAGLEDGVDNRKKNFLFGLQELVSQGLMAAVVYLRQLEPENRDDNPPAEHPAGDGYARRMQALLDAIKNSANPDVPTAVDEFLLRGPDAGQLHLRAVVASRIDELLDDYLSKPDSSIDFAISTDRETRSGLSLDEKRLVFSEVRGEESRLFLTLAASAKIIQDFIQEVKDKLPD
jgi:hypothetical protein